MSSANPQLISEAFTMAESAKINFHSLAVQVPQLRQHPFYKVVEFQLEETTRILSGRPDNDKQLEMNFEPRNG